MADLPPLLRRFRFFFNPVASEQDEIPAGISSLVGALPFIPTCERSGEASADASTPYTLLRAAFKSLSLHLWKTDELGVMLCACTTNFTHSGHSVKGRPEGSSVARTCSMVTPIARSTMPLLPECPGQVHMGLIARCEKY